jgi:putative DNA primase/helicase
MITSSAATIQPPITENIPEALRERRQWVNWCLELRELDKLTKVPYTPGTDRRASSTDLMSWTTFEEAFSSYQAGSPLSYDGIGFMFSSADPFVGIDLDECRDPESGEISPWAKKIISRVREGYIEASPSGTGVHIIVVGSMRDGGMRKNKVEMYSRERFFTITGVLL